ncbi:hypothetical protein EDF62_3066 [Leucobacter luti]|uniref:Uncharacterized protein n=1 Tax=Leucobacter luti TaxID=340320 RepID=A0A4R6RSC1_9MICO|nr:hypothetical protein EDF62_3066 [Leucobacter luti]
MLFQKVKLSRGNPVFQNKDCTALHFRDQLFLAGLRPGQTPSRRNGLSLTSITVVAAAF